LSETFFSYPTEKTQNKTVRQKKENRYKSIPLPNFVKTTSRQSTLY